MNPISKPNKRFSERLRNPRVLTNPEEFLGPNYKDVLKFWMILDELSEEQWGDVKKLYDAFCEENSSEWLKATDLTIEASENVVGGDYANDAGYAAYVVTKSRAAYWATREIIGGVESPVFLKMFYNL